MRFKMQDEKVNIIVQCSSRMLRAQAKTIYFYKEEKSILDFERAAAHVGAGDEPFDGDRAWWL